MLVNVCMQTLIQRWSNVCMLSVNCGTGDQHYKNNTCIQLLINHFRKLPTQQRMTVSKRKRETRQYDSLCFRNIEFVQVLCGWLQQNSNVTQVILRLKKSNTLCRRSTAENKCGRVHQKACSRGRGHWPTETVNSQLMLFVFRIWIWNVNGTYNQIGRSLAYMFSDVW